MMNTPRRYLPPVLYFFLLSMLTNLVYVLIALGFVYAFSIQLAKFTIQVVLVLVLWKTVLMGILTAWLSGRKVHSHEYLVRFTGYYVARLVGFIFGGFLGVRVAPGLGLPEWAGGIIGAVAIFLLGRWQGHKISLAIGGWLDHYFSTTREDALQM